MDNVVTAGSAIDVCGSHSAVLQALLHQLLAFMQVVAAVCHVACVAHVGYCMSCTPAVPCPASRWCRGFVGAECSARLLNAHCLLRHVYNPVQDSHAGAAQSHGFVSLQFLFLPSTLSSPFSCVCCCQPVVCRRRVSLRICGLSKHCRRPRTRALQSQQKTLASGLTEWQRARCLQLATRSTTAATVGTFLV
jgi:hypothetical protein